MYAWIIDQDHLAEPGDEPGTNSNAVGVTGPSDAPDNLMDVLVGAAGEFSDITKIFTFRMYDDDGILYYTGRMITDEGDTEDACYGPLGDYGGPNAGCTDIRYEGHPEMDCG